MKTREQKRTRAEARWRIANASAKRHRRKWHTEPGEILPRWYTRMAYELFRRLPRRHSGFGEPGYVLEAAPGFDVEGNPL